MNRTKFPFEKVHMTILKGCHNIKKLRMLVMKLLCPGLDFTWTWANFHGRSNHFSKQMDNIFKSLCVIEI